VLQRGQQVGLGCGGVARFESRHALMKVRAGAVEGGRHAVWGM
jgi:hypothetical protein